MPQSKAWLREGLQTTINMCMLPQSPLVLMRMTFLWHLQQIQGNLWGTVWVKDQGPEDVVRKILIDCDP